MLVTPFALVMHRIGIDRCGPLMTVVVPWDILQASSRFDATSAHPHQVMGFKAARGRAGHLIGGRGEPH
jgi:hypothetical protein